MKLREEARIKEKVEFRLDTRHVVYLIVWSVVFSGIIFYTGMVVGKKGQPGVPGVIAQLPVSPEKKKVEDKADREVRSLPLMPTIGGHPEHEEMTDVVLNAMARLRLETLKRVDAEDRKLKQELQEELFPKKDAKARKSAPSPEDVLVQSAGVKAPPQPRVLKLGQVPIFAIEPEPEPPAPAPILAIEPEPEPPAPAPNIKEEPARKQEASATPKDHPKPSGDRFYSIQAKSFRDKAEADVFLEYLLRQLGSGEHKPYVMPVDLKNMGRWYRVRVGRFSSLAEAQKFKEALEKKEGLQTILVNL